MDEAGVKNCCISEITVAELKYGVEKSTHKESNRQAIETFITEFPILPIFPALDIYAREKARLKSIGKIVDEFDLLIGSPAIFNGFPIVTRNVKHFERLKGIEIENWIDR